MVAIAVSLISEGNVGIDGRGVPAVPRDSGLSLADDAVVRAIPAEPIGQLWQNSRAMLFILVWFATNILFGAGLVPILGEETSIAWEAHIGGFLAGLLLFPLFDRGVVRR